MKITMRLFKILFLSGLFIFPVFDAWALQNTDSVPVLTFREALTIASEKSPSVVMADERVREALERLNQTRSYLFPRVEGDVSESRQTKNLATLGFKPTPGMPSVVGPFNAFDARIKLTQILFDLGTVKRLEAARAGKDLSAAEFKKAKQDALALVGSLFVEARRTEEAVKFAKISLRYTEERYRLANTHWKLGTGSETDVKEAKSEWTAGRYLLRAAQSDRTAKMLDLKAALGFSADKEIQLAREELVFKTPLPKSQNISEAARSHPEVQVAEENLREQKAQEAAEKAGYFPTISGLADYGASGDQPGRGSGTYDLGLALSWPIFEGGNTQARVAEASAKTREAKTNFNDVSVQKEAKAIEAKNSLKDARLFLLARGDTLLWRKKEMDLAKERFQNGTASVLDLIGAQRDSANAENDAAEAAALYRTAQINLAHALGQMEKFLES